MNFLVLCHLRWNFVFQRPQHLMSRCAKNDRVVFWEEPVYEENKTACVQIESPSKNLYIAVPHIPAGLDQDESWRLQEALLTNLLQREQIQEFVLWYYTPMARHFSRSLSPSAVIYDCMDELSGFRGAPPGLRAAPNPGGRG